MLPYTAEVYASVLAQYNAATQPAVWLALALHAAALALCLWRPERAGRAVALILAAGWLWTGIVFFVLRFATIHFAAPLYGAGFVLAGLLVLWRLVLRDRPVFRVRPGLVGSTGFGLALLALAGYPLLALAGSFGLAGAQAVGVAPGPTALFTLGLLLMREGRAPVLPAILPLVWCLVGGLSAWAIAYPDDAALPVLGLLVAGLIVVKNRRAAGRGAHADAAGRGT